MAPKTVPLEFDKTIDTVSPRLLDHPEIQAEYGQLAEGVIRLLCLQPGVGNDGIHCELIATNLSDNPVYEAISYAWGTSNMLTMNLNKKRMWVGHNLLACLQHLRHKDSARIIWVDAICINQSDAIEKSSQVSIMSRIYHSASRTLLWLGESVPDQLYPRHHVWDEVEPHKNSEHALNTMNVHALKTTSICS